MDAPVDGSDAQGIAEALGRGLDTGLVCSIGDVVNAHAGIVAQGSARPVIGVARGCDERAEGGRPGPRQPARRWRTAS
ncbi:hypothetical protein DUHN55_15920 [Helicobacter pylori]